MQSLENFCDSPQGLQRTFPRPKTREFFLHFMLDERQKRWASLASDGFDVGCLEVIASLNTASHAKVPVHSSEYRGKRHVVFFLQELSWVWIGWLQSIAFDLQETFELRLGSLQSCVLFYQTCPLF